MGDRNDGGPAFVPENDSLRRKAMPPGLSLRDWFAGQMLSRFVSDDDANFTVLTCDPELVAQACYQFADAMLTERAKARSETDTGEG